MDRAEGVEGHDDLPNQAAARKEVDDGLRSDEQRVMYQATLYPCDWVQDKAVDARMWCYGLKRDPCIV